MSAECDYQPPTDPPTALLLVTVELERLHILQHLLHIYLGSVLTHHALILPLRDCIPLTGKRER